MNNKMCHKLQHLVLFVLSILLLCLKTATSTSVNHPLVPAAAHYKCIEKERDALLDFKAHIQDPDSRLSAWTTEKEEDYECCKWEGVICNDQTGHITELDLNSYSLGGKISPSLLNLSYLSLLDLSDNSFSGTIPAFIGSLTQLSYLYLSYNSFSGTIPSSIGALTKLTHLDLSFNYLLNGTCIPQELGNLTNMQDLSLSDLSSCTVENIDWLSHMSDLNTLTMDDTSLAKADKWVNVILRLQKLSFLSLRGCDLSQVMHPYSSSSVNSSSSSIDALYLNDNNLNSSTYHWLWPLTSNKLRDLGLSKNMLDGKSFGNVCSLTYLEFSHNSAVVNLPEFLNNWSGCTSVALQTLYASYSHFTGSLSDQIQTFSDLERLYFDHNELNGSISEKVWELPKLQTLHICSNYLREAISENTGRSKLSDIDLSSCNLGPRFPKWIQDFKSLIRLNIANNRISNKIPVKFWNIWPSQLIYLNLSANNISGEVPDLVSNFSPFYSSTIDLSSNNFYGRIPKVPSNLASLDLSRNKFHGGISFLCEISDWRYFNHLDLSHNSFTGKLPDCLWHFTELEVLNLGCNILSGRLPASVDLISLQVLSLYNNNLSGELPVSLKNCTRLTFLDLGANKFTGNVPPWIGVSLSELYVLSLTSNKLLGPIPLQLCQLANLQILDLSMNNLYGTIPSCLNNLTTMVQEKAFNTQNVHQVSNPYSTLIMSIYIDQAMFYWLGNTQEFSKTLGFLKVIDLSRNNLTGHIPYKLTDLRGLIALNLSNNALDGKIPWKIGEMRVLLALDVSRNNLFGNIPISMSNMNLLCYLDVSFNNLSGRIPSSTQLQSFDPTRYTGNAELCGLPLTKYCPGDNDSKVPPMVGENEDDGKEIDDLQKWFYIGSATGFPIGFWIVCGTLLLNRSARHAFFHILESLQDMIYVKVVVFIAKLKRFACK